MTQTEVKLMRKSVAGLIMVDELETKVKGTVHVAWLGKDCRVSIARKGVEYFSQTYKDLGSFVTSPYCISSDLDLIVSDVIKSFTQSIQETFFK